MSGILICEANNNDQEKIKNVVFNILIEYELRPDCCGIDAYINDIEHNSTKNNGYFCVLEKGSSFLFNMK